MAKTASTVRTLATALLVAACSNSTGGPGAGGSGDCPSLASGESGFTLSISGDATTELCGPAQSSASGKWGAQLLSDSDVSQLVIESALTMPPAVGTYDVVDYAVAVGDPEGSDFLALGIFDEPLNDTYTSVAGTVTIDSSTASQVAGSFMFSARVGTVGNAAPTIEVSGSFVSDAVDP